MLTNRQRRILWAIICISFIVCFVNGLFYVGDFSLPVVIDRLATSIIQVGMVGFDIFGIMALINCDRYDDDYDDQYYDRLWH